MEFIETSVFTRLVQELLSDDEYRQLQNLLADQPDRGSLIPGGGGIRKVRFSQQGIGKRSGVRVIYYWMPTKFQIYMLLIYAKSKKTNLSDKQKSILQYLVKGLNNG